MMDEARLKEIEEVWCYESPRVSATARSIRELIAEVRRSWGYLRDADHRYVGMVRLLEKTTEEEDAVRAAVRPIYSYAHEEHGHARLGDEAHDPDCALCHQLDALHALLGD